MNPKNQYSTTTKKKHPALSSARFTWWKTLNLPVSKCIIVGYIFSMEIHRLRQTYIYTKEPFAGRARIQELAIDAYNTIQC